MSTLSHKDAMVRVEPLEDGRRKVRVELLTRDVFMPVGSCITGYSEEMIRRMLELKGPAYLCDEILRDESPEYVQKALHFDLLSYCDPESFVGKRLLDFGCGAGASTMVLARMFPRTQIVGIELEEQLLSIARLRADHYGYRNVELLISPSAESLPHDLGTFDFVVFSAVFEHLLPAERRRLLPQIWQVLRPGGTLFLDQTPYRFFPVETHTTGLPLINYLPDRLALAYAKRASKRTHGVNDWNELLRRGIRGGSVREILELLGNGPQQPLLLAPSRLGVKDRIDLWYAQSDKRRHAAAKRLFLTAVRAVKAVSGASLLPYLSLAISKQGEVT